MSRSNRVRSELLLYRKSKHFHNSLIEAARVPLFVGDPLRILEIVRKNPLELLGDPAIVNRQIDFLVQSKRAVIEVRASNRRPDPVYDNRFGMQKSSFVFIDVNATEEQGAVVAATRGISEFAINLAG